MSSKTKQLRLRMATWGLVLMVAMAGTTGCYHNEIIVSRAIPIKPTTQPNFENGFHTYLIFGLIPMSDDPIDLSKVCPGSGAGYVEVEMGVVNGIINFFLGWLISFQSVKVWCA